MEFFFLAVLVTKGLRRKARTILVKFRYQENDRLDNKKNENMYKVRMGWVVSVKLLWIHSSKCYS